MLQIHPFTKKMLYNLALNTHQNHHSAKAKWEKNLSIMINDEIWKQIFQVCHKSLQNNEYIWFQMRIIYRILGTQSYLAKIHKIEDGTCTRCKSETETNSNNTSCVCHMSYSQGTMEYH